MAEFGEGISKENTLLQEIDAEFCKLQTQGMSFFRNLSLFILRHVINRVYLFFYITNIIKQVLHLCLSGEGRCDGVGDWLQTLGLRQYENTFVTHGFDDVDFLVRNFLVHYYLSSLLG